MNSCVGFGKDRIKVVGPVLTIVDEGGSRCH